MARKSTCNGQNKRCEPCKSRPMPEEVHVFIGGSIALRFFPDGTIQVPVDPERRAVLRSYLSSLLTQLEGYR